MSLSPSDILQRLKQLKLWQENQEELLKKSKSVDVTTASDYQTIEGLSAFDDTPTDSKVISPTKSFNELLEEKLAQDPGPRSEPPVVKRPFLRKGAGLERFRLKPRPKVDKKFKSKRIDGITPLKAPDLSVQPKAKWEKIEDCKEHVEKINKQLEKCGEISEQTLYEKQLEKELLIFEALEQRANNSSFCSTNSSVMRILSSTPSKIQTIAEEKKVHWESQSEDETIETNLDNRDIADILFRLKNLAKSDLPSSIEPSEDDSSSISSTDLESTLKTTKCDVAVETDEYFSEQCPLCGDQLEKKIIEYEKKIQQVIKDKDEINELKKQLEQKDRDLTKRKREFEDERQDLIFELETEKKKLIKEKQTFQNYMKEYQNRPNKKERQEITNLKQELANLSETLKLKETKNGMCQARLRNQIKHLEKENANLKDQVEKLTKENAKLTATQKVRRKSNESKILLEINKNVNKLTKETLTKSDEKVDLTKSKKLDLEDSLLEIRDNNIEVQYENTFRNQSLDSNTEIILKDGSKQIKYPNGNIKTTSPDGNLITIQYFNGDKQETNLLDGTIKYYFAEKKIQQTTYPDGLEVVEFPDGVIDKKYHDGKSEVILPDGVIQTIFPDGTQQIKYVDGSIVKIKNNEKVLLLPNGQKEIETADFKKREYPDGTVKILYPDGTQETKYANGRVRIKDGNGTLIIDTQ